jgi:hypothetical protein
MVRRLALLACVTCTEPTEIIIELTTNVSCEVVSDHQVSILLGSASTTLTTANAKELVVTGQCDGGVIGTLAATPSGARDEAIGIGVVLGVTQPTSACDVDASGCIVARRSLRYSPAMPLHLPISLDAACLGVSCSATETCERGFCVPNTTACQAGVCIGPDAGAASCPPPSLETSMPAPVLAWHFDEGGGTTTQDDAHVLPAITIPTTAWTAGASGCGTALHLDGSFTLALGDHPAFVDPAGMTISYRVRTMDASTSITRATAPTTGFDVLGTCLDIYAPQPDVDCPFPPIADGQWHRIAISFKGNGAAAATVRFYIEGIGDQTYTGNAAYVPAQGVPLGFARAFVGDVDEVLVFDKPL